jgi:hypothetical protein
MSQMILVSLLFVADVQLLHVFLLLLLLLSLLLLGFLLLLALLLLLGSLLLLFCLHGSLSVINLSLLDYRTGSIGLLEFRKLDRRMRKTSKQENIRQVLKLSN